MVNLRDQTQTWSNFSLKFPLSLQIPLGNDQGYKFALARSHEAGGIL